jgi:hypothetical protein
MRPRSIAHEHMRRKAASKRFAITGEPRSTISSRRSIISALRMDESRRPRQREIISFFRTRSIS